MCRIRRRREYESATGDGGEPPDQSGPHDGTRHQSGLRHLPQTDGPGGFGLEKFDAVGAKREKIELEFKGSARGRRDEEAGKRCFAQEGQSRTRYRRNCGGNSGFVSFLHRPNLGAVLAKSAQCQECVVKQYFRYYGGAHGYARGSSD